MNIKVGFNRDMDEVRKIIFDYFPDKKIKVEEEYYGSRYIFNIIPTKGKSLPKKDFYTVVTEMILEIILKIYSKDIIVKKVTLDKTELKSTEKEEIVEISKDFLLDKENFAIEKEYFINQIKKYIMDSPFILIDGFVRFRIREFDYFISLVIDKGIEEFTAEKEYKEFIKILQYFVEVQEPKYDLVNLVFQDGNYKMLDENDNIIDSDFFTDIVAEIDNQGISKDDLLVSSLIVIAPKKLIVHLDEKHKDDEIIKVISSVFQDRVYFCLGCEKCNGHMKLKRGK